MGSSIKRKPADRLRINTPLKSGATGTGAGGGVAAPKDINNACPLTIRSKLSNQDVATGTELVLAGNVLRLAADQNTEVGKIPAAKVKQLETCLGLGIEYPTVQVVADKQGVRYAEFTQ